ncbi:MAG: YncE family protein [Bacteroidia bacterium]|nr:YncE family protein [Bacteroidia bacterium]
MKKVIPSLHIITAVVLTQCCSCTYDKLEPVFDSGYPKNVENIIITKCAVTGCHTDNDKDAAAGLSFETWNKMFLGGRGGAVVIPYRTDFSTLIYYTNTYPAFGSIRLEPVMPFGAEKLSYDEVEILHNWIRDGATDNKGFVKFSDYENKSKFYICNRGCDVVTVMDAESGLAMRYIDVGIRADIEEPVMIKVSPDKLFWYVIFYNGTIIQKFRTSDNSYVGQVSLGVGFWTSICITNDSRKAFVTDAQPNGKIIYVDLENMQTITTWQSGLFNPYDSFEDNSSSTLYVAPKQGNYIYKINATNPLSPVISEISLDTGMPIDYSSSLDPSSILLSADETKYFVTCQMSSELRIMKTSNDSLLAVIPLASNPARMYISSSTPYLFVSCMGAPNTSHVSAVYVINYLTNSYVTDLFAGNQSRGIAMDEAGKKLYVANRNVEGGSAHHAPVCGGKNGYITVIDVNTLQLIADYKTEVSVEPFDITK